MKRLLGREIRIPVAAEPDSARLIPFPGDDELPPDLRDRSILEAAMASDARAMPKRRQGAATRPPHATDDGEPIVNVVLVSHCNFKGNSALHVHAIASELHRRGLSPVIAVPDEPETVEEIGRPPFPVLTYDEARGDLRFPDRRGPDLVHAWTPRELVRQLTVDLVRRHRCRYVVHLEDNEETVLAAEHGGVSGAALEQLPTPLLDRIVRPRQAHPFRMRRFLDQSVGMTVLIERLLEFAPAGIPAAVIPAGFDESVLYPRRLREEVRAELGVSPADLVIVYPGNIHLVNMAEMASLWKAVARLRDAGRSVVLVKTGWGSTQIVDFPPLDEGVRDLGWVPRGALPDLLAAADVLVQPGGPGPFNDYRFPSKLPEFLASGHPVVLPRTNLGLLLRDGEEALLLDRGDATEIAAAVARLADDPALRDRLGTGGREFALRKLRWSCAGDKVQALYGEIAASGRPVPPSWALDGADPPVKLVALLSGAPDAGEAELARAHGIYGFCLDASMLFAPSGDFRFCFRLGDSSGRVVVDALSDPLHILLDDLPVVVFEERTAAETWQGRSAKQGRSAQPVLISRATVDHIVRSDYDHGGNGLRHSMAATALDPSYATVFRKVIFRALLLRETLLFVDASSVWPDQDLRAAWLAATRSGLGDGVRQYYASRGLPMSDDEVDQIVRGA